MFRRTDRDYWVLFAFRPFKIGFAYSSAAELSKARVIYFAITGITVFLCVLIITQIKSGALYAIPYLADNLYLVLGIMTVLYYLAAWFFIPHGEIFETKKHGFLLPK